MKVLQINAVYGRGSTGTIVRDIQQRCLDNGIECYVAYQKTSQHVPNGYKIGSWFSYKIHAILCRIGGKQAYYSTISTLLLLRFISKIKPDVVNLHNLHSNYINLNILLKYLAEKDIRTIVTLHDCWFYTGGCYHYTLAGCHRWQNECGNCPKKLEDTKAYLYDASKQILKDRKEYFSAIPRLTVVGVSNWIGCESAKSVFPMRDIVTIYNGIDTEVFKYRSSNIKRQLGILDKVVYLGPATKWLNPANHTTLIYFLKNMKANEVLVLLGAPKSYHPISDKIIPIEYCSDRIKLSEIYSMADVFVNCTREESLSMINLEAQSCGTPVVTYNGTGVQETVDNISGFSVESGKPQYLYDKAYELAHNSSNLTEACARRIRENFSKEEQYLQYIRLYKSNL